MAALYPVTLFLDEMKSEDTEVRIGAMRQLRRIAAALGPERTRSELLPSLSEQMEDDDEVLLVMAEELGGFIELVGGPAAASCLVAPLGQLATVEETVVRDKAVESSCLVIAGLDNAAVVEHVLPVIQKLTQDDWFMARVSACGLFASAYARLSDEPSKATLRSYFTQLCADETPMVKRAASKNVGAFARVAAGERDVVLAELLPLFHALAADDQDSVRLLAIENCTAFAGILGEAENNKSILPLVKACALDKSWRVRNSVAREFAPLARAMGLAAAAGELLPLFTKLLADPEAEVRAAVARNLAPFASVVGADRFVSSVAPQLRELAADPAPAVRAAAAEGLTDAAVALPRDAAVAHVVPLVMLCLRDDAADVRLKALDNLAKVIDVVSKHFVETDVLPAFVALGNDALWRVREKVLDQIPLLAGQLGAAIFEAKVLALYLALYTDPVNSVRMAASRALVPLMAQLGAPWARAKLVPRLRELFSAHQSSYLQRITVLYALKGLVVAPDAREAANDVLDLVVAALGDAVPNVRLVAAGVVRGALDRGVYDAARVGRELRPALQALAPDADVDVRELAAQLLTACG